MSFVGYFFADKADQVYTLSNMNLERERYLKHLPILTGQISEQEIVELTPNILLLTHNQIETVQTSRQVIIVSGPPGSGKDTIVTSILAKSTHFGWPKTVTTRAQRESEIGNDPYIRMTEEAFEREKAAGAFMETDFHGSWYGSPKAELVRIFDEGKTPILRIDPNGAESILKLAKEHQEPFHDTQVTYAYVVPTNGYELYQRLMKRTLDDNGNNYYEALHKTQQRIKSAVLPDLTHMGQAHLILINKDNNFEQLTDEFLHVIDVSQPTT
jgi:guanylate kinase